MRRALLGTVAAVLVLVASGCETTQDDEMAPKPSRTVTVTTSPSASPAPESVPVGRGDVSPDDVVWAQGSALHVGRESIDLSPAAIEAFLVVRGGVYVLSSGELWFTDLSRLRPARMTGLTRLGATRDRSRIVVSGADAGTTTVAFDTRTGRRVGGDTPTAAPEDLLGDVAGVVVGPDRFRGAPRDFEPVGRAGTSRVYGLARTGGRPTAVVSCDLGRRVCTRLGPVEGSDPVVFGSGR